MVRDVDNSPFPDTEMHPAPRPLLLADGPEAQRRPCARVVSIANGYFDTLQLNDGQLFADLTEDCDRIENDVQTTNNAKQFGETYPIAALGCAEQFSMAHYRFDDRLRDRRFPLVDEERGLVLAAASSATRAGWWASPGPTARRRIACSRTRTASTCSSCSRS